MIKTTYTREALGESKVLAVSNEIGKGDSCVENAP